MAHHAPICLLHIGKTGGSFLRSIIRHNEGRGQSDLRLLPHQGNAKSSAKRHGADRRLALVIRDPETRFVSGFYSRMRQGRPTYDFPWSAEEAIAYSWFASADDLAVALGSSDERMKSAARFAMASIEHLALDYAYYFGSLDGFKAERSQIAMCIDLPRLTVNLDAVMERLGFPDYQMPHKPRVHASPGALPALSEAGRAGLRAYWAEDWAIYEAALAEARRQFP